MKNYIRFSPNLRKWFYGIFGLLFLSGFLWIVVHNFLAGADDFDAPQSFFKTWLLKIHGAGAMASLVIFGVLIPSHMRRGWQQNRNRTTAVVMILACFLLIVSGYALYYCGSEELRLFVSSFHSWVGCVLPLLLIWHIARGRKSNSAPRA
ncbi:MAG: hypothetical protein WC676_03560 [Candidatus Omnitrophota bacterium]